MKEKENKTYSAIHNYVSAIVSFYRINDIVLDTKKISKFLPEQVKVKKDRAYTHEEISKLLEISDEKMRAVILLLSSTGIRIGAIPSLRLRNLEQTDDIYKVTVYENTREEYITYCTPECKKAIDSYLDMRKSYGELIHKDSYLIREYFDVRDPLKVKRARAVTLDSLHWKLITMARRCHIRKVEHQTEGIKIASMRKDVAIAHGYRKFFSTQLVDADVKTELRWLMEGHDLKGNDRSYVKPTEQKLYEEYQKAIDNLTINEENRLRKKVKTLEVEKSIIEVMASRLEALEKKGKRIS
jgi:integrase/recombinase XerD